MTLKPLNIRMLFTAMVAAGVVLMAACGGGSTPEVVEIPVSVAGKNMDPGTIRVKQGDMVTLKINAEKAGEFHLHGYDIEQKIDEDVVADFYFVAKATGRFRITFHHTEGGEDEKEDKGSSHGHDDEEKGANGHGEIFMSEVLGNGETFSFVVADHLADRTIPFHSHLHPEVSGAITVSHDAPESATLPIRIKDLSAHPSDVKVRPGTTLIWTNNDTVDHLLVSGHHPDLESADKGQDEGKEDHDEHAEGEEIDLGFLEVGPR